MSEHDRVPLSYARPGASALALAGLLLGAFPLIRPFFPTPTAADGVSSAAAAEAMASSAWVVSHLIAGAGFVALPFGFLAIYGALAAEGLGRRRARIATLLVGVAAGLLLIVLGGETFGLPAAARGYAQGESPDLVALVERVRTPVLFVTLLVGLVGLAAGGITMATAIWRSRLLSRSGGLLLAVGLALWMPLLPQVPRLVDGVLIAVGAFWLAFSLFRLESTGAHRVTGRELTGSPPARTS